MPTTHVHDHQVASVNTDSVDRAGRWLVESGIQEEEGGVARYYRSDTAKNAPVSTEITGYAASALLFFHARSRDLVYLDRACKAGRFLIRKAWNPRLRAMPFELPTGEQTPQRAYFFDMGIVTRGLLALWRATGEAEFLAAAVQCGEAMAADFDAGGEFHPILLLPSKEPAPRSAKWSCAPGCYQLKAALAWRELAEQTGRDEFIACNRRALEYALQTHERFLTGEAERERIMDRLHAYCYFLEGLLPVAGAPDCAAALRDGIERTAQALAEIAPLFVRSDVYAQLLRVRLFASALGVVPLDRSAAAAETVAIEGFQVAGGDSSVSGGFYFGRRGAQTLPFVNPVSAAFCAQALEMWREREAGRFQPDWRTLV